MFGLFFYLFGVMIALGGMALAAVRDFKAFQIPNISAMFVLAGFGVAGVGIALSDPLFIPPMHHVVSHILSAMIVFVITYVMFAVRGIGAGDAKLLSVAAIWFPLQGAMMFVFYTSLIGGLLGLVTLLLGRFKPVKTPPAGTWIDAAQQGGRRVPYGIAIALGFVCALVALGYFDITTTINPTEN